MKDLWSEVAERVGERRHRFRPRSGVQCAAPELVFSAAALDADETNENQATADSQTKNGRDQGAVLQLQTKASERAIAGRHSLKGATHGFRGDRGARARRV